MQKTKVQPRPGEDVSVTEEMDADTQAYLKRKAAAESSDESVADLPDEGVRRRGLIDAEIAADEDANSGRRRGVTKYIRTKVRKPKMD